MINDRMSKGARYPFMRLEYSDGEVRYIDDGSYQYNINLRSSSKRRPILITIPNETVSKEMMYKVLQYALHPGGVIDAKGY